MATYESAGVSIEAGERAVERIRPHVASTRRPEVLSSLGGFGGLFAMGESGYSDPVLVATTDGVGTKANVATATGRFDTIGQDLVAMCVDDLACQGADPLFFLDYISVGSVDVDQMDALVAGVAEGCRIAGCALIGGEMAEHPGAMRPGEFDLVGFAVGAAERGAVVDGSTVQAGDHVIGLHSPGLRSNGYSLARHVLDLNGRDLGEPAWGEPDAPTWADELLRPSVIYSPAVSSLCSAARPSAIAHITGGGLDGNLGRVIPSHLDAEIDPASWEEPRVFRELRAMGIADAEMRKVFNLGIGMVVVIAEAFAPAAMSVLESFGHAPRRIGTVVPGTGAVRMSA